MSTLLQVMDVTKVYKNQPKPGLDHVSFKVAQGEFLGIMGASGSGKTTLLNVLSTIDVPTSGHIIMGKTHIEKLGQGQAADFRKNNLGFIFQEYFLLDSLTVRENIGDGTKTDVTVVQTTLDNPIGFANSVATLLVSDQLYQTIASGQPEQITVVSINGGTTRSDGTAYTILKDAMPENIYLASAWQRQTEIIQLNSSTYLLIAFATIIFLIATGSILYFQNLSAVTYDRDDYNILQRMGYNRNMIKRCVRRQIQIYFVIPYMMGMLHSIFAIICYKSALMDDVLGQAGEVILPVALAVGIFSTVYFIYYQVTKYSCYKAVIN